MTVAAVAMVKDEVDIIATTVRQMASQVDFLMVADNGSTDGTAEVLADLAHALPLYLLEDAEVAYYQSEKMTRLALRAAAAHGADWVLPFDADEFWYSPFGRIADVLEAYDGAVATAAIYDHRPTGADSPDSLDPVERMGWREREPLPLHKVACRPVLSVTIAQGNHGAHYPTQAPLRDQLVVRHFPIRSPAQMIGKARNGAAAYAATDLPEDAGAHWRQWGALSDEQLCDVYVEHYWFGRPEHVSRLVYDPALVASTATNQKECR